MEETSWSFNGETLTWGHVHQNVSMHSVTSVTIYACGCAQHK